MLCAAELMNSNEQRLGSRDSSVVSSSMTNSDRYLRRESGTIDRVNAIGK